MYGGGIYPSVAITADTFPGVYSEIQGPTEGKWFACGSLSPNKAGNYGDAGDSVLNGQPGVVIVRVPADQAAGVDPGSWVTRIDYYAEVTDGIVTDTYQERFYGDDTVRTENGQFASPEQPDDLIPCHPSVTVGWTYADGEFASPVIEEVEE